MIKNNAAKSFNVLTLIGYNTSQYKLNDKLKTKLDILMEGVSKEGEIVVVGYSDMRGTDKYNLNLGLARANEVFTYLKEKGYNVVGIKSSGFNTIVSDNNDMNRRVELLIK